MSIGNEGASEWAKFIMVTRSERGNTANYATVSDLPLSTCGVKTRKNWLKESTFNPNAT